MQTLVVYDSIYGNTEQIAKVIVDAIDGEVKLLHASKVTPAELENIDLLVVGAPTQGGRATQAAQDFLNGLPEEAVKGMNVASFDTRLSTKFVGIFGYAAGRMAKQLKEAGAKLIAPPEGFYVKGSKGPMKDGEAERAAEWAKELPTS
jgi:flavodoxin